jgi:UDP-N-acetylmuramoyl-tripeptide--D-alanyl-D-alanine ligase
VRWQLWKVSDLAESVGASWWGEDIILPDFFTADSREVRPGAAFVAIRGNAEDGHDYIKDALHQGASLIIAEKGRIPQGLSIRDRAVIEVNDSVVDLARMASAYLSACLPDEVIAITGSVGKTTTREVLKKCFEGMPLVFGAEKSFNTLIGCSLTILAMPAGTNVLILEMGTNKPGEIEEMVQYFPPTRCIITEVSSAHLEGLVTLEGVIAAKMEITRSPHLKTLIFNADNENLANAAGQVYGTCKKIGVGVRKGEVRICQSTFDLVENLPRLKTTIRWEDGVISDLYCGLWGTHNSLSLVYALTLYRELGYPLEEALRNLETMTSLPGRGRVFSTRAGAVIIDDSYNANPSSMKASLNTFSTVEVKGRKLAILGSMKELGKEESVLHEEILRSTHFLDALFLVGEEWKVPLEKMPEHERSKIVIVSKVQSFAVELAKMIRSGDGVLIKGSHSHHLEKVVLILMEGQES